MNKSKVIKIVVPVIIVLVIAGIWVFKNNDGNTDKPAIPTETGGQISVSPGAEEDFALKAETLDLVKLKTYGLPIVIDFGAGWCGPCKKFAPILEVAHDELLSKAIIKYVDTDEYGEIASEFPIQVILTQVFINADGTPYVPSESITIEFNTYNFKDTGELAFTVHQGGLTADEFNAILVDMGVKE